MAEPIDSIERALQGLVKGMKGPRNAPIFRQVSGFENSINPKPQAQLWFRGAATGDPSTGGLADVGWRFHLEIFIGGAFKEAMQEIKEFYARWPKVVLQNQDLGLSGILGWVWEEILEPGPDNADGPYLYAVLEITVTTEEGD